MSDGADTTPPPAAADLADELEATAAKLRREADEMHSAAMRMHWAANRISSMVERLRERAQ
jgi:hypothetical protein